MAHRDSRSRSSLNYTCRLVRPDPSLPRSFPPAKLVLEVAPSLSGTEALRARTEDGRVLGWIPRSLEATILPWIEGGVADVHATLAPPRAHDSRDDLRARVNVIAPLGSVPFAPPETEYREAMLDQLAEGLNTALEIEAPASDWPCVAQSWRILEIDPSAAQRTRSGSRLFARGWSTSAHGDPKLKFVTNRLEGILDVPADLADHLRDLRDTGLVRFRFTVFVDLLADGSNRHHLRTEFFCPAVGVYLGLLARRTNPPSS